MGGAFPPADRQPRDAVAGGRVAGGRRSASVERMTIQRMEHVGIVVDDLAAATAFFVELGLKLQGSGRSKAIGLSDRSAWGQRSRTYRGHSHAAAHDAHDARAGK